MAHSTVCDAALQDVSDLIELQINDICALKLTKHYDQEFYEAKCISSLTSKSTTGLDELVSIGNVPENGELDSIVEGQRTKDAQTTVDCVINRIRQLLSILFEGIFHVGTIRQIHGDSDLPSVTDNPGLPSQARNTLKRSGVFSLVVRPPAIGETLHG